MKTRFPIFVLILLVSLGLLGYGLFEHQILLYQKPAPEDDGEILPEELAFSVGEIQLTDWARMDRIRLDRWGHLIDTEQEAECLS